MKSEGLFAALNVAGNTDWIYRMIQEESAIL
jgi:hypothetical protein